MYTNKYLQSVQTTIYKVYNQIFTQCTNKYLQSIQTNI